jgi:hypothetical protein
MRVKSEVYKGIEFVRISNLPPEQKEIIRQSLSNDKVIKILKEEIMFTDCIQYRDYLEWFEQYHKMRLASLQ